MNGDEVVVRIPSTVQRSIDVEAERRGITRGQLIAQTLLWTFKTDAEWRAEEIR